MEPTKKKVTKIIRKKASNALQPSKVKAIEEDPKNEKVYYRLAKQGIYDWVLYEMRDGVESVMFKDVNNIVWNKFRRLLSNHASRGLLNEKSPILKANINRPLFKEDDSND